MQMTETEHERGEGEGGREHSSTHTKETDTDTTATWPNWKHFWHLLKSDKAAAIQIFYHKKG